MKRKQYPTDLKDEEWQIIKPLIPPAKPGGWPRSVDIRAVINGILYVLRCGCPWRYPTSDMPAWSTVYRYFRQWRSTRVWEELHHHLREQLRAAMGRQATPSAGVLDSQSVKTTHRGDPFREWVADRLHWRVEVVGDFKLGVWMPKDAPSPLRKQGFQVLPRRWVVERTFAWLVQYRRLAQEYEYLSESSEAWIYIAMCHIMLRRLARIRPSNPGQ